MYMYPVPSIRYIEDSTAASILKFCPPGIENLKLYGKAHASLDFEESKEQNTLKDFCFAFFLCCILRIADKLCLVF